MIIIRAVERLILFNSVNPVINYFNHASIVVLTQISFVLCYQFWNQLTILEV